MRSHLVLVNPDLENMVPCAEVVKADVFLGVSVAKPVRQQVVCGLEKEKERQEAALLSSGERSVFV